MSKGKHGLARARRHGTVVGASQGLPAVALEDAPAAFREHDQRAVVADGRDGLDEPRVSEVPQIAPVRVERPVLTVAEIAGGHDAEGADGCQRADL